MVIRSSAATPTASFELESATRTANATLVGDDSASGEQAVQFTAPPAGFPVHPGVVYTQADINAWGTSSAEYAALAGTGAGSLTTSSVRYTPVKFGTEIDGPYTDDNSELNLGLKDQSGYAKIQAVLWAADGNNVRREKVISYLKEYGAVKSAVTGTNTSYEWDAKEQYRLVSGWGCTNLAQAAEIISYEDTEFKRFLKEECYPIMDWPTNPNWHASFADSKLAIAAYLGDTELWADAKRYYYERLKQSIFHPTYDTGNKVGIIHQEDKELSPYTYPNGLVVDSWVPPRIHTTSSPVHTSRTQAHWGSQLDSTLALTKAPVVAGVNAERMRDLGHVNMSLGAWMHGLRTLKAQGESATPEYKEAYARVLAGYAYHSERVVHYINTGDENGGQYLEPAPLQGNGGGSRFQSYYGAKKIFGSETPQSVLDALALPLVYNYARGGANHMVAERFADGD